MDAETAEVGAVSATGMGAGRETDPITDFLEALTPQQREDIAHQARRTLAEAGLSYNPFQDTADDRTGWRFDAAPVLLDSAEWRVLSAGAVQRARMIDLALEDVYGPQTLLREGLLPTTLLGAPEFIRDAARWPTPVAQRLIFYCIDVARRPDGVWVVLDDHVDRPEGMGWALANRVALSQAAPEMFMAFSPRRLGRFFAALQTALETYASGDGRVALLTAGSADPAYFSNAYMARFLDFTLVEPGDLTARHGEAQVKTLEGLRRIDVALRAVPSLGVDPIYAPGPSPLAPPGVLFAAKRGLTKFANMVGAGVFDGRALAPWSAGLTRRLLGEEPILLESLCLDLGDPAARETYLADPAAWRVGPMRAAARPGGRIPIDPFAGLEPEARARRVAREGFRHVARGMTELSEAPTLDGPGGAERLGRKPFALRLFVVRGPDGFDVMPGGLAQSSEFRAIDAFPWHGHAKDVWVVEEEETAHEPPAVAVLQARRSIAHRRRTGRDLLSRVADNLFWLGRYTERTEANFRVLKLVLERFTEAPRRERQPEMLGDLLELHLGEDEIPAPRDEAALLKGVARLVYDPQYGLALRQSLDGVHRNATETRAHLSRDAWRDVATLCTDPAWRGEPETARPLTLSQPVENGIRAIAAFSGAQHENMSRNFAWLFLELGKRIERGAQTVSMLRALLVEPREDEQTALLALLQLCDSFFAYRARYMTTPEAAAVLDLLALDEINPRSLTYQLAAIEAAVAKLPRDSRFRTPEHKTALALLTDFRVMDAPPLAALDKAGRRGMLERALDRAEEGFEEMSERLAAHYFAHAEAAPLQISLSRLEGVAR